MQELKSTPGPWFVGTYYEAGVNDGSHSDWIAPSNIPHGKCAFCGNLELKFCGQYKDGRGATFHRHRCIDTDDNWRNITAENGTTICGNYDYEEGGVCTSEADAHLIVTAVNSHEPLLKALEAAAKAMTALTDQQLLDNPEIMSAIVTARAALAAAGRGI